MRVMFSYSILNLARNNYLEEVDFMSSQKYEKLSQEAEKIGSKNPDEMKVLFAEALKLAEKEGKEAFIEFFKGKIDEIEGNYYLAIDRFVNSLNLEPKNVFLLKQFGIASKKLNDQDYKEEAIRLFNKAISDDKVEDDYEFFQIKGLLENEIKKYNEAITSFEMALDIKKEDIVSLRGQGISLCHLGDYDKSLDCIKKAVEINDQDFASLKTIGIVLNKFGNYLRFSKPEDAINKYIEALKYFNEALEIKENKDTLEYKGITLYKIGQLEGRLTERLREAITYLEGFSDPSHEINIEKNYCKKRALFYQYVNLDEDSDEKALAYLDMALQIDPTYYEALYQKSNILDTRNRGKESDECFSLAHTIEVFSEVMDSFKSEKGKMLKYMKDIEKKFKEFVDNKRSIPENFDSFLAILRKWNSYTPILPSEKGDNKGGGYFLFNKGKGIVIDPGFNFIENFSQEGFKIADIDAILISHSHNDHTADLESILTLVHQYNRNAGKEKKTIDLFLNLGTFKKYSGYLDLRDDKNIGTITILMPDRKYSFPNYGITIFTTRAKHDEILDVKYSLSFVIYVKNVAGKKFAKIGFTCDTGWDFENENYFQEKFLKHEPELIIAHLGSIKPNEFKYLKARTEKKRNDCFYPNHLGLLGMAKLIEYSQDKNVSLVILSEFGEELKKYRKLIAEKFNEIFSIPCLPGDVGLYVRLKDLFVFCCVDEKFIDYNRIKVEPVCDNSVLLFHNDDCDYEKLSAIKESFENNTIIPLLPLAQRIKSD